MATAIPDPSTINVARAYVLDGLHYRGLLETAHSVRSMQGLQGIEVTHSDGRITISLAGKQDPNITNGASLSWSTQPLEVCVNNVVTTIYVLAGVALS
jgi:hypothetical protein